MSGCKMIIYIIEAYEMDGRSYTWGGTAYPLEDAARKVARELDAEFPDLEFLVQEFTLDLTDFQKAQENVQ